DRNPVHGVAASLERREDRAARPGAAPVVPGRGVVHERDAPGARARAPGRWRRPGRRHLSTALSFPPGPEFPEGAAHALEDRTPAAFRRAPEETHRRIPGRVLALRHPAPVGD